MTALTGCFPQKTTDSWRWLRNELQEERSREGEAFGTIKCVGLGYGSVINSGATFSWFKALSALKRGEEAENVKKPSMTSANSIELVRHGAVIIMASFTL